MRTNDDTCVRSAIGIGLCLHLRQQRYAVPYGAVRYHADIYALRTRAVLRAV